MITAERYHDISCGHRVVGHESKCQYLHGHNYRFHFTCISKTEKDTDDLGRVVDFGVIKHTVCQWLEDNWDHKMLLWRDDPLVTSAWCNAGPERDLFYTSIVMVPFNPTAENMASYILEKGNTLLLGTGARLISVRVDETRKCSATADLKQQSPANRFW